MSELILRALSRAGRTINNPFSMGGEYVRPQHGDAQRDLYKVTGDMRKVGNDLRTVAKRELKPHGK